MKVLLDTNIIIHRESHQIVNKSIGQLFRLIDKGKFTKCIHPITLEEIERNINNRTVEVFRTKLESYEQLKTISPFVGSTIPAISERSVVFPLPVGPNSRV